MSIPDRWLQCPRKGKLVADLFLPCKTPLDSRYNDQVDAIYRFTPEMLISSTRSEKCQMVIDLTNTDRFYDKNVFTEIGLDYQKVACSGHKEAPNDENIREFNNYVCWFTQHRPGQKIIVHCTHGFNRTGFLIVAFLVSMRQWNLVDAIRAFIAGRAPGIYKQDYLFELSKRFSKTLQHIPAPPLPDWSMKDGKPKQEDGANSIYEDGDTSNRPGGGNRKRTSTGALKKPLPKVPKFMAGVSGVCAVTNRQEIVNVQRTIQAMCHTKNDNFPGAQPVSMDTENMYFLCRKPYQVSWKADGTRYMMAILGEGRVYMVDRDNCVYHVNRLAFPSNKSNNANSHLQYTLLDGEMVLDVMKDSSTVARYLVYDIVCYEHEEIGEKPLAERFQCIHHGIIQPRTKAIESGAIDKKLESFSLRQKQFWELGTVQRLLDGDFKDQLLHESDGLIFQPAGKADRYQCGKNPLILKWKPPELNTIDFLLKIQNKALEGQLPTRVGVLYAGGESGGPSEVEVPPPIPNVPLKDKHLNGKIVECCYDFQTHLWHIMRERTDKSFPNHITTVRGVMNSIFKPVTKMILYKLIYEEVLPKMEDIKKHDMNAANQVVKLKHSLPNSHHQHLSSDSSHGSKTSSSGQHQGQHSPTLRVRSPSTDELDDNEHTEASSSGLSSPSTTVSSVQQPTAPHRMHSSSFSLSSDEEESGGHGGGAVVDMKGMQSVHSMASSTGLGGSEAVGNPATDVFGSSAEDDDAVYESEEDSASSSDYDAE